MSDAIIILGIVTIPLLFGRVLAGYWLAVTLSTVILSALLHVGTWLSLGYVAPFVFVSIPVSLIAFLLWSMLLVWLVRRPWTTTRPANVPGANEK